MPHVAQGSFGIVYKGTVKDRKEDVAVKDIKVTSYQLFEEWKKEVEFMGYYSITFILNIFQAAQESIYCGNLRILCKDFHVNNSNGMDGKWGPFL